MQQRLTRPPTLHVRGGSVSRRGLNLLAGNRAQLTGAYCPKEKPMQSPAVLRVGARGRRFLQRSGLPRMPPHVPSLVKYCNFVISVRALILQNDGTLGETLGSNGRVEIAAAGDKLGLSVRLGRQEFF